MMINFLLFALRRYARFGSYVAVFLAGVGFSLQGSYFWVPLAISVVLGSLCAYERRPALKKMPKAESERPDAFTAAQSAIVSAYMNQLFPKGQGTPSDMQ